MRISNSLAATFLFVSAIAWSGCENRPATAPIQGVVYFNDKPLEFGSVMLQPMGGGPPARGEIQSDGSFALSTYAEGDGALLGKHRVRVMCNSVQDPDNTAEFDINAASVGKLLIPRKYTQLSSSGLTAEVLANENPTLELRLSSEK